VDVFFTASSGGGGAPEAPDSRYSKPMRKKRTRHRRAYNDPGHAHELTFACYHNYPFLSRERVCLWLAEAIRSACKELDYSLWAYVFMPNHVHLIVHPRVANYEVSTFLKRVKTPVSRKALAFLRGESPQWLDRLSARRGQRTEYHFWQRGGGYDRNVVGPKTLEKMIEYIHLNPVRKQLVERGDDWKWSSAGWFQGEQPNELVPDRIPAEWTVGMSGE
jgi:putative transposase